MDLFSLSGTSVFLSLMLLLTGMRGAHDKDTFFFTETRQAPPAASPNNVLSLSPTLDPAVPACDRDSGPQNGVKTFLVVLCVWETRFSSAFVSVPCFGATESFTGGPAQVDRAI